MSSKLLALKRQLSGPRGLLLLAIVLLGLGAVSYKLVPRVYNGRKLAALQGRNVYDVHADAERELERALASAKTLHKRVMVVMGGNWCQWCLTLDDLFRKDDELEHLLKSEFVTLKLDADAASELDEQWGKPTELGVPVLVFLEPDGRLAHVQDMVPLESWGGRLLAYDRDEVYATLKRWVN